MGRPCISLSTQQNFVLSSRFLAIQQGRFEYRAIIIVENKETAERKPIPIGENIDGNGIYLGCISKGGFGVEAVLCMIGFFNKADYVRTAFKK